MAGLISQTAAQLRDEVARRRGYRPLTVTERQRRFLEQRFAERGIAIVQPRPAEEAPISTTKKGAEGIPFDVLFALEAVRSLADTGNLFAKFVYEQEREALGIDRPKQLIVP